MVAEGPSKPPAGIEDFLWNMHSVLAAAPGPINIDDLRDAYATQLGHKCAIERFLVVGDGGLAATLKRIPHVVTLVVDGGVTSVKQSQPADFTRAQLIEADQQYRRQIMKKNAAKAAALSSSKAKAAAPAPAPAAAPPAGAPKAKQPPTGPPEAPKRPAEAPEAGSDAKKPKAASDVETLARMLVQGVVRVLQNRAKDNLGALPISQLEDEFKALWQVPFKLSQAGEPDALTFLRKWPSKVEILQDGDNYSVQLAKKVVAKAKAGDVAAGVPPVGTATAVKAGAIAKVPPPAPKPASPPAPAATAAKSAPEAGPSIPKRGGGPTRPPASIEDFLWNMYSVVDAFGGPVPLDQLKEAYSKHLGHKCAIERFLVIGEGGLAATLKRIPHIVTVVQEPDGEFTVKATLPPGTTKERLIVADSEYRKALQSKPKAPPAAAASAAPTATAAKSSAPAPPEGESDPKKAKTSTENRETLCRMLVQGVVKVLQKRQTEGKGSCPVSELENEFKALWKVPFNLTQAGETDTVTFLLKFPAKVEVCTEDGIQVVKLTSSKGAAEKTAQVPPKASGLHAADPEVTTGVSLSSELPALTQQAVSMLEMMREMVQKQEALVQTLNRLGAGSSA
eukprot:TRINITY_DN7570_c0_g1_i1.p1 TRINITY_DN7570_c0_g1~~TRINITY_DN7570_c0_g1_i1.p1  ORF type:complete len:621 (+),score=167.79 TRINITY_DN7570_c0_g1_i1:97-1959(+)